MADLLPVPAGRTTGPALPWNALQAHLRKSNYVSATNQVKIIDRWSAARSAAVHPANRDPAIAALARASVYPGDLERLEGDAPIRGAFGLDPDFAAIPTRVGVGHAGSDTARFHPDPVEVANVFDQQISKVAVAQSGPAALTRRQSLKLKAFFEPVLGVARRAETLHRVTAPHDHVRQQGVSVAHHAIGFWLLENHVVS